MAYGVRGRRSRLATGGRGLVVGTVALLLSATPGVAVAAPEPAPSAGASSRSAVGWPFSRTSIWNTPVGSRAEYVDAELGRLPVGVRTERLVVTTAADPLLPPRSGTPGAPDGTATSPTSSPTNLSPTTSPTGSATGSRGASVPGSPTAPGAAGREDGEETEDGGSTGCTPLATAATGSPTSDTGSPAVTGSSAAARPVRVPRALLAAVASADPRSAVDGPVTVLQPDGRTLVTLTLGGGCRPGDPAALVPSGSTSLLGSGIVGGPNSGSGLTGIGGSIRAGELTRPTGIRHALKLTLPVERLYAGTDDGTDDATDAAGAAGGTRWPARPTRPADAGARSATGSVEALRVGALLAVPPWVSARSLELRTAAGRALFAALQDYGAYVVGGSTAPQGDPAAFLWAERRAATEYRGRAGVDLTGDSEVQAELRRLLAVLAVVDNNRAGAPGGGGTPRAALAPPLRAPAPAPAPRDASGAGPSRPRTGPVAAVTAAEPGRVQGAGLWALFGAAALTLAAGTWMGRRAVSPAGRRSA